MRLTSCELGVTEAIHGVIVKDPCRWLEDRPSPATVAWLAEQERRTLAYFSQEEDDLMRMRAMVAEYLDVELRDQPTTVAGLAFYRKRTQGQQQASLYVRDQAGRERLLFDPEQLGPLASVSIHQISRDGTLLAFDLTIGGTNRKAIRLVDVPNARVLEQGLPEGYARGFAFAPDSAGFHYCHEEKSKYGDHEILFRRLGESEQDEVWFRFPRSQETRLGLFADEEYLGAICLGSSGGRRALELWVTGRNQRDGWHRVPHDWAHTAGPMLWRGEIYAISYDEVPRGKLVAIDRLDGIVREIVPQQEGTLTRFQIADDHAFLHYQHGLRQELCLQQLGGNSLRTLEVSEGHLQLVPIRSSGATSVFYTTESTCEPPTTVEFAINTGQKSSWQERSNPHPAPTPSIKQSHYQSMDGTEVPITLVRSHPVAPGVSSPVLMTGYGGFGVAVAPEFSVLAAIMVSLGSTFALPRIRGGNEFGREWHDAARRHHRQTAIDDFLAAAQWLHDQNIATLHQLGIFGGSNAGLLVAAAMTQRPDLFGAVVCIAPLLDMVRFEVFAPTGKWIEEYGTADIPEDFAALLAYSPYHHVQEATDYPATLFVTGDRDDRCDPAHVRKMAARLQDRTAQRSPVLVDYSADRGHAAVLPLSMRIDALARRLTFLCRELKIPVPVVEAL